MVLVTGSSGIVGTRIVFDLLSEGIAVRAMRRSNSDLEFVRRAFQFYAPLEGDSLFDAIQWVEGDLHDLHSLEVAMEGVEQIYHTAALVSYAPGDAQRLIAINTEGTANVVNYAIDAGVRKLCHISSVAAIGQPVAGLAHEGTSWKRSTNRSAYGLSKFLAEREVWRGAAEGLPCVIVNPSVILGPARHDQSSGMLMHLFRKGIRYFPPGTAGFVDVRDVSAISIALMQGETKNERYILNADNVPFRQMLEWSADLHGNAPPTFAVKPWMLSAAWPLAKVVGLLTGKVPRLTRETVGNATKMLGYANEKVRKSLGIEFIPVEESLAYYKDFHG